MTSAASVKNMFYRYFGRFMSLRKVAFFVVGCALPALAILILENPGVLRRIQGEEGKMLSPMQLFKTWRQGDQGQEEEGDENEEDDEDTKSTASRAKKRKKSRTNNKKRRNTATARIATRKPSASMLSTASSVASNVSGGGGRIGPALKLKAEEPLPSSTAEEDSSAGSRRGKTKKAKRKGKQSKNSPSKPLYN